MADLMGFGPIDHQGETSQVKFDKMRRICCGSFLLLFSSAFILDKLQYLCLFCKICSFNLFLSHLLVKLSSPEENGTSHQYEQIDRWIQSGNDADRENLVKQLLSFKYLACCSNSPEWWWRYGVGQYFNVIALYKMDAGKTKNVTVTRMRTALDSLQHAALLFSTKQAVILRWYLHLPLSLCLE